MAEHDISPGPMGITLPRVIRAHLSRAARWRLRRSRQRLAALLALATAGISVGEPFAARSVTAVVAAAVPDVPGKLLKAVRQSESYLGFDTNVYPGDRAMRAYRDGNTPYEWVGYYLAAPCHKDHSWSGKRERIESMGYGTAVLYVGQQAWPQRPVSRKHRSAAQRRKYRASVNSSNQCTRVKLTGTEGANDATDAIVRTTNEGFPEGTVIFLDVEYMDRTPVAMRDYYRAWVTKVLVQGRYRPGVYVHTHNATLVYRDLREVYAAAGAKSEAAFWVAGSGDFGPGSLPQEVGHTFASAWQGRLDIIERRNGIQLPIDVSVASVSSPSTHRIVAD